MTSELQLSLLLKRQVEDVISTQIYDRNNHASLLAWREYREVIRKRVHPKPQEVLKTQESEEFTISPYKNCLSKYKDSLSKQKYLREMQSEGLSPRFSSKDRSYSSATLKKSHSRRDLDVRSRKIHNLELIFPLATLNRLEDVINRANLKKTSREYCTQLQTLANTIIAKLRE